MTLDDIVTRNTAVIAARADGEVLALHEASGNCFSLGGSGALVWEVAKQPITVRDICGGLQRHYAVDPDACAEQILAYVETLVNEGILQAVPAPA